MEALFDDPNWWLDEIDLDPTVSPLRMGTRALGDQPWLLADAHRDAELELKALLHDERPDDVFAAIDGTEDAAQSVVSLLEAEGVHLGVSSEIHPLERGGLAVQEDLCLLRRHADGWHLVAASLSFPSRWRLTDKIARPLVDVHGPVEGYAEHLAARVTALIDRLGDRIVRRRNWFVHPDPTLFQPSRPLGGDPVVPAHRALDDLYVRSERQTLRRVPGDGWALFTIKIQQCTLRGLVERDCGIGWYLTEADPGHVAHRGFDADQRVEVLAAMGQPTGSR